MVLSRAPYPTSLPLEIASCSWAGLWRSVIELNSHLFIAALKMQPYLTPLSGAQYTFPENLATSPPFLVTSVPHTWQYTRYSVRFSVCGTACCSLADPFVLVSALISLTNPILMGMFRTRCIIINFWEIWQYFIFRNLYKQHKFPIAYL